jgi:uncharacterized protein
VPHEVSYLLVDGENIDATLGSNILGGRPLPEQRPRWERVREFVQRRWGVPCKTLFFLDVSSGTLPTTFIQALLAMSMRPIPLSGGDDEKVVDVALLRTLDALRERPGHVMVLSHDADFAASVAQLLAPGRHVGVLCFHEFLASAYRELEARGLELYDLENDAHAFNQPLPRVRIIPIAEFDPVRFL